MEGEITMILKELEFDLPYKKNEQFIKTIQIEEGIEYSEALRRDYDVNWKQARREFQLMTRCITSMIERIMRPTNTKDCWKILIECVDECSFTKCKNLLGVCVVQVKFEYNTFLNQTDYDKKKIIVQKVVEGMDIISNQVSFVVDSIYEACEYIVKHKYVNEWMWNKKVKIKDKIAKIKIKHDVSKLSIFMVFIDQSNTIIKEVFLVNTIPDERHYDRYLFKLVKISENEVALITKFEKEYVQSCD